MRFICTLTLIIVLTLDCVNTKSGISRIGLVLPKDEMSVYFYFTNSVLPKQFVIRSHANTKTYFSCEF